MGDSSQTLKGKHMNNKIAAMIAVVAMTATVLAMIGTQEERLRALEHISKITYDNLVEYEELDEQTKRRPSEDYVRERFQMTHEELLCDARALVERYSPTETNMEKQSYREYAIMLVGRYGNTNDLEFLARIWSNNEDHAQTSALSSAMSLARNSEMLFDISKDVLTNSAFVSSPQRIRARVYTTLYSFGSPGEDHLTNEVQVARIASFFLERAALEGGEPSLFVDRCAYTFNPWYRHSQQRRENLARLRPPGLTGRPAEIYDAAQRDAAQED